MRARRPVIAPGSLADRLRSGCHEFGARGATMADLHAVGLARPEDVEAEVDRLRALGYIVAVGRRRGMRYRWHA